MPEISRTTNEIIQEAFRLIGIYSSDRNLSGGDLDLGLRELNIILDSYNGASVKIPYNKTLDFYLTPSQQSYVISNKSGTDVSSNPIMLMNNIVLIDSDIQYPIRIASDDIYYNNPQNLTSNGKPEQVFLQNDVDQTTITFDKIPDKAYQCVIKGKFTFNHASLNQVIDEVPAFYHSFLEYKLAQKLHNKYSGSTWSQSKESELQELERRVDSKTDCDLKIRRFGMFVDTYRERVRP